MSKPIKEAGVVHEGGVLILGKNKKLRGLKGVTIEDIKRKFNELKTKK